jgi:predicted DNA-binding transcriptional regulator YafY
MAETTARILALLNLLQTHRQWPGPELARRLEVTERTLRRDIERLRYLGYQVEATRGAAGGYRLEAGSALPPLLLTDDEAVTMAIGLRMAAALGLEDGEQTTLSALAKLEQVLPSGLRHRVNALAAAVHTLARLPNRPETTAVPQEMLGQLALACRDRERIRFHYAAADGQTSDRAVEPHSLVTVNRTWFLVCWDLRRDDWRTFRVDRMSALFHTRLHFPPRELPAADAAEFVEVALSSMNSGANVAEAILDMPIAAMREYFGPWAEGATAIDAHHTSWPVGRGTPEEAIAALAWIPSPVSYEVRAGEDFLAQLHEAAGRMLRASEPRASEPRASEPRASEPRA